MKLAYDKATGMVTLSLSSPASANADQLAMYHLAARLQHYDVPHCFDYVNCVLQFWAADPPANAAPVIVDWTEGVHNQSGSDPQKGKAN